MVNWLTTSTILEGLRRFDDRDSWVRLDARFRRPIVRFARSLGLSTSDAEDAAQETLLAFARAYREGGYDRSRGRLSRWLFGIAFRQALDHRRRSAKAHGCVGTNGETSVREPIDEGSASHIWDTEWEESLLEQCLAQVRLEVEPQTMQAFETLVRLKLTPAQAAATLGMPVKSIYNAKHRVLGRVRELRTELEGLG